MTMVYDLLISFFGLCPSPHLEDRQSPQKRSHQ